MQELTTTNHNEMIGPFLHVWTWQIPVYLFLGGLVAGMMIISGYLLLSSRFREKDSSASYLPLISLVLLSLGMFALFLDLEHKLYVWRVYLTFKPSSPMSWGSWILLLIYPALIANIIVNPPEKLQSRFPKLNEILKKNKGSLKYVNYIGITNVILGALVGTYTGILLSTLGARPLWSTSLLWLLFLLSGLSSAAAFVHMITRSSYERQLFAKTDNVVLTAELFVIIMMIIGLLSSSRAHIQAVNLILTGYFAASFWVFVISLGIVIPLFYQILAVKEKIRHSPIAPILVISGGLILRFIIVFAGQYSHY